METTYVTLEIIHDKPIEQLAEMVAGRAYTIDGVTDAHVSTSKPIIWKKVEGQSREEGLIETLRGIAVGQVVMVPGWVAHQVNGHIAAAKRGTDKMFSSRTLTTGVRIVRHQ
jgi:hypothetical protein